ncbi:MAG: ROK family protein [Gaiellaceae bacterium]
MVGALDIGGTHVSAARVDPASASVDSGTRCRVPLAPDGERDALLGGILHAACSIAAPEVVRWAVAVPGPFDYERGICTIRGVAKLEALYGVDLRAELAAAVGAAAGSIVFLNDAHAFVLGEWWAGAASGHERAVGITLGSGLGSAFLDSGRLVTSSATVPPGGELYRTQFRGLPVEETISRRALLAQYGDPGADVEQIAARARAGEERAELSVGRFAADLAEFLGLWITAFEPTCLAVGGSIARAWDLLGPPLERGLPSVSVTRAAHIEDAALLGAARHAADAPSSGP